MADDRQPQQQPQQQRQRARRLDQLVPNERRAHLLALQGVFRDAANEAHNNRNVQERQEHADLADHYREAADNELQQNDNNNLNR